MIRTIRKEKLFSVIMLIVLVMTLFITGCENSNNESKKSGSEVENVSEQKGYIYEQPLENNTVYKDKKFKYMNNDKCNFAIPYPGHFEVKRTQDNNVTFHVDDEFFTNTDIKMYIEIMGPGASLPASETGDPFNETYDAFTESDRFEDRLLRANYNIESGERAKEGEIKSSEIETNFSWITEKESSQIYKAITDEVKFEDFTNEKDGKKYSSIKWYFYLDDEHPMVISTLVPQDKKNDMDTLLEYMISNMKRPVINDKTQDVTLKSSSNKITIPASFSIEREAELAGATEGKIYLSPTNEGKQYAGAAISVYHYDKSPENFSYEELNSQKDIIVASTMVDDLSEFHKNPYERDDLSIFNEYNSESKLWLNDKQTESVPALYGAYSLISDNQNNYFWNSFNNEYLAFKVKSEKGFDLVLFTMPYEMKLEMSDLMVDIMSDLKDQVI